MKPLDNRVYDRPYNYRSVLTPAERELVASFKRFLDAGMPPAVYAGWYRSAALCATHQPSDRDPLMIEARIEARRERRLARNKEIIRLRADGLTYAKIAEAVGTSVFTAHTVCKNWAAAQHPPGDEIDRHQNREG